MVLPSGLPESVPEFDGCAVGLAQCGCVVGCYVTRRNGIYVDPLRRPLVRESFRKLSYTTFGGGVGRNRIPPWNDRTEAILTILPLASRFNIFWPASCDSRNTEVRFTADHFVPIVLGNSAAGARRTVPALLTRISTEPKSSTILRSMPDARPNRPSPLRHIKRLSPQSTNLFAGSFAFGASAVTTHVRSGLCQCDRDAAPKPRLEPVTSVFFTVKPE